MANFFTKIVASFFPGLGNNASVLAYHSVAESEAFFAVSPAQFLAQMNILALSGLKVRPLAHIVADITAGRSVAGSVAITFDDGYRDNHKQAYAILKEKKFPATVFLATGSLGGSRVLKNGLHLPVLSGEEVQEMAKDGLIDFGAHTVLHPDLITIDADAVQREMEESKRIVETLTGKPCTLFAYPFGRYNDSVIERARAVGFVAGVTVDGGLVGAGSDLFRLRRNAVDSTTTLGDFRTKISRTIGWFNFLKP